MGRETINSHPPPGTNEIRQNVIANAGNWAPGRVVKFLELLSDDLWGFDGRRLLGFRLLRGWLGLRYLAVRSFKLLLETI